MITQLLFWFEFDLLVVHCGRSWEISIYLSPASCATIESNPNNEQYIFALVLRMYSVI